MKTLFVGLLLALSFTLSASGYTGFFYSSSDESLLSGRSDLIEPAPGIYFRGVSDGNIISFDVDIVSGVDVDPELFVLYLRAPGVELFDIGNKYLVTALTHEEASGSADYGGPISQPGIILDRYTDATGDMYPSIISGSFTILELAYDPVRFQVSSFAINFQQFENTEASGSKWIYGSLRYNSDIPLSFGGGEIPEPSTYAGIVGAFALGTALCARRKVRPTNSVSVGS